MAENNDEVRSIPAWAIIVLSVTLAVGAIIACYTGMYRAAAMRKAEFILFEFHLPKLGGVAIGFMLIAMSGVVFWFISYYGRTKHWLGRAGGSLLIWIAFLVVVNLGGWKIYDRGLSRRGVGTMQTALDTEYHQDEGRIMGNLGVYGGRIKIDGESQFYVCRQIDTFGPFDYQVLVDTETQAFSTGYEEYSRFSEDGMTKLTALSVYHYQDGYWLVVKKLVNVDDLGIKLERLDDLRRYIVQMQYNRHSGKPSEMLRQFEQIAGDAVQRRK